MLHEKAYDPYSYNPDSVVQISSGPVREKAYDPYSYSPDSGVQLSSVSPRLEYETSVIVAQARARIEEREKEAARWEKIETDMARSAKEREEAKRFNALPPYKKLFEMLIFHAKYLSKSSNLEDLELEQMIYTGLYELRNGNFEPMDNVFKILETRAMNDSDLAIALQDWKKFYDECREALEKRTEFERKKTGYEKVSFFGRAKRAAIAFFNIISGKEEIEEKGKQM